jgi:hypothetical protein
MTLGKVAFESKFGECLVHVHASSTNSDGDGGWRAV